MSKRNKIIVIVVSYNGKEYFPDLMPTLLEEKYQDIDIEVLVVDNNSSDGSADYLARNYPKIKVIRNHKNLGFVGANNIGYQYAKDKEADYIYLLNQDTIVTNGFLRSLYDFAIANRFGALQSKLRLWPDKEKINTIGNVIHYLGFGYGQGANQLDKNDQQISKINYASGAGVFLSMDVLAEQGYLFDETMFMYLEDLDLGWTLNMLGYDSYLIPNSIVYHKYQFDRSMKHYTWFERNRLWLLLKNYKLATLVLIFPAWLVMELGQIFFAIVNKRLRQKLRAYSFLFSAKPLNGPCSFAIRADVR